MFKFNPGGLCPIKCASTETGCVSIYEDAIRIYRVRLRRRARSLSCGTRGTSVGALKLLRVLELKVRQAVLYVHLLMRVEHRRLILLLNRSSHVRLRVWVLSVMGMN